MVEKEAWNQDGCGLGLPGDLLREMLHHVVWAREKCAGFEGRDALVKEALAKIDAQVMEVKEGVVKEFLDVISKAEELNKKQMTEEEWEEQMDEWRTFVDEMKTAYEAKDEKWNQLLKALEREDKVDQLLKALGPVDNNDEKPFSGICLAIIGRSGTGKTALTAKLASLVRAIDPRRPVIIRFCGTSKGSVDGLSLVQSLCHQIQLVVEPRIEVLAPVPENYDAAVSLLHTLLKNHAVVLFIDSLDQLSDIKLSRSKISFLKGVQPHADTRIVVSALPDDKEALAMGLKKQDSTAATTKYYYYGCDTCLATHLVSRVVVSDFSEASAVQEARTILQTLFARHQRALTVEQWDKVMSAVAVEPTALYLNLAMYMCKEWRSYDGLGKELRGGVAAVTEQIFEGLERDYGALLTRAALGFITWSVQGVTDVEMEDLLSLHEEVLAKVLKYCPGVKRMPSHVWLRLRGALKGLVVEHNGGCLQWYHRQLWEAAQRRYGHNPEEKKLLHVLMGMYFGDVVEASVVHEKQIHRQPLTYSGAKARTARIPSRKAEVTVGGAVWTAPVSQINHRRAVEACVHLLASGMFREVMNEICHLETVCARFKVGVGMEIIRWLSQLQGNMVAGDFTSEDHFRVRCVCGTWPRGQRW